ncbi:carboxylesterase/lipase family protein [Myceligenerans indicum]|uniref:Carboxylic ester hydrolase n=1 Tax=Myceligenerans indicum TaxID=2593663 RepID=A0ABS1LGA5_9MICO|nr:carboxylesterase family protein [Myceligenerans indicum]MBL0885261.1 carboxylesterase family protein [Myceligenerans indicum]
METAEQAAARGPRSGASRRSAGFWVPLALLALLVLVLGWLNKTPWWGWGLVAGFLLALVLTASWWLRRGVVLRVGAWLVAAAVAAGTVVLAHPGPQFRMAGGAAREATQPVETREGPVTGVRNDAGTVEIFAGVPYAQPPVGDLRWRAPRPPEPRSEVLVADRFSAAPVQPTTTFATRALSQTLDIPLEDTFLNPYPVSEDSLYLNIWRATKPASAELPVLVYVPGGGFATGSGALPLYDGEALASTGEAIVITINYRLGVMGFLCHPELAAESSYGASGNYGILDQIAALEWVRQNIAAFGGDPDRVTLAGESAGGESVCILGATPLAEGLFDGIIGSSGACMGTEGNTQGGDQSDSRAVAEDAGERLAQELGVETVAQLRELPVDRITEAAGAVGPHWRPSVDGYVLDRSPAEIYAAGDRLDVPTMVGSNADEDSLIRAFPPEPMTPEEYRATARKDHGEEADTFLDLYPGETEEQVLDSMLQAQTDRVFTRGMYRWARLQTDGGQAPAYLYFFTHTPPDEGLQEYGAYHGAEVMYAFDNLGADGAADYGPADYLLRDQLSGYWLNFVRTGDPNGAGLPPWSTFADSPEQVMGIGVPSGMTARPRPEAIDYWMSYQGPVA